MSSRKFKLWLLLVILLVTDSQGFATLVLFYFVMDAGWSMLPPMLKAVGPDVLVINLVFILLNLGLVRPVSRYLFRRQKGEPVPAKDLPRLRSFILNYPYIIAFLSVLFFVVGTTLISWRSIQQLGWPSDAIVYGLIGGIISGFLAVPLYIYLVRWVLAPVLEAVIEDDPSGGAAGRAGFRMPLRLKLMLTVLMVVGAITGYTLTVGYSRVRLLQMVAKAGGLRDAESVDIFVGKAGELAVFFGILWLAGIAVAALIGWFSSREITEPLVRLRAAADRVRDGQFSEPVRLISNDELGELGQAFNRMMGKIVKQIEAMSQVMAGMREGIERLDQTVNRVLAISTEQSTGATQQASAVQEVSSIAEEIVVTAKQIADKAKAVDEVAGGTVSACVEGAGMLSEAEAGFNDIAAQAAQITAAMENLQERFGETYKIVDLMEEIADQTELLALNAALEAAGAGEAGRRFSVVAEATRRLALRSSQSASEIKALIEGIQGSTIESTRLAASGRGKVDAGGKAIGQVVQGLQKIMKFAGSTSNSVREITLSTNQQSSASEQLAASIDEVREVAARVEDGAREIESAVSELLSFAESLREVSAG